MSSFELKCIDNRMRDITKLKDNYTEVKKIPSLLICNQNGKERELNNKKNLQSSVLLRNVDISCLDKVKSYNETIYSRNIPTGKNIPINIDMRPLPSDYCLDKKFEEDQKSLENYNKYVPEVNCNNDIFLPNKGTVKSYFDNIDLDSELKNINEIDTKCSKRLFKVDPNNNKSQLSCYKDALTNNYMELDCKNGYTWCNYNKCSKLEEFPICESKEFKCNIKNESKRDIMYKEKIRQNNIKEKNDNEIQRQKLEEYKKTIDLLNKKMINDTLPEKEIELSDNPNYKPYNIVQYNNGKGNNPNNITNIYAPIVNRREYVNNNIEELGYKMGLNKSLDMKIKQNLDYYKKLENKINETKKEKIVDQQKILNSYCANNIDGLYIDRYYQDTKTQLYDIDCRGQTKRLYSFGKKSNKVDCVNCEQLFNNQTKRNAVNVNEIPYHIFN